MEQQEGANPQIFYSTCFFMFMPKVVIKKSGNKEEFIPEKIVTATIKSGAPPEKAREIAKKITEVEKKEVKTVEIRKIVLDELKNINPDWHENFLAYDKGVKRLYRHYKHGLYK